MEKVLLISQKDVKEFCALNGNIDPNYLTPQIAVAQDIELEQLLGTSLIDKLQTLVSSDTLTGDYEYLVEKHIKPVLTHYALVYLIPFQAYKIQNGGVFKHESESSFTPDKVEVDWLLEKARTRAQNYASRMVKYLCENNSKFPEYNNTGLVNPDKNSQGYYGINI